MSTVNRIEALKRRHGALHDQIEDLASSPAADDLELQALKREKLALKDDIAQLEAQAA